MDAERARELLAQERQRIERLLPKLAHEDTGEPADEKDPGNQAADLYQDELDEGLSEDLREDLAAGRRLVLPTARTGSRSRAASRFPTSVSKCFQRPSGRPKRKLAREHSGSS